MMYEQCKHKKFSKVQLFTFTQAVQTLSLILFMHIKVMQKWKLFMSALHVFTLTCILFMRVKIYATVKIHLEMDIFGQDELACRTYVWFDESIKVHIAPSVTLASNPLFY